MYEQTNLTLTYQEFKVYDYDLDDLKNRYDLNSFEEVLIPPVTCLLPGTKFYVKAGKKRFRSFDQVESIDEKYTILLHPLALAMKCQNPVFLSIVIDFQDWCSPGKLIRFPVVKQDGQCYLDPFKTKQRMESRGFPPYVTNIKRETDTARVKMVLKTMKKLGLKDTPASEELYEMENIKSRSRS